VGLGLPNKKMVAVALLLVIVAVASVLVVTDLRGRAEGAVTTRALASTKALQQQRARDLLDTQQQIGSTAAEVQRLGTSISKTQASLATSSASFSSTERSLFFGGFDISALNSCLSGVTQALDQVAVGQTKGALASLRAVSTTCNSAKPPTG
jgi:septal ring factor EnvC (AmiA/AmiB activator)